MKSKEQIKDMLCVDLLATTAVYTTSKNGINENYGASYTGDLLNVLDDYNFIRCEKAAPENLDINTWCQELDNNCKDGLLMSLYANELYIAKFSTDEDENLYFLIWE